MTDPDDRFGMPASAFQAARDSHGWDSPVFRMGMVATLPATQLLPIVIDWMWESPSELIPNNDQIAQLRTILRARPDATESEIRELIVACEEYLKV